MKNGSIGKTIMKASKYVYIAGMAFASLSAIVEVFTFLEAAANYPRFPFFAFALIVAKYLLIVFSVWFHLSLWYFNGSRFSYSLEGFLINIPFVQLCVLNGNGL